MITNAKSYVVGVCRAHAHSARCSDRLLAGVVHGILGGSGSAWSARLRQVLPRPPASRAVRAVQEQIQSRNRVKQLVKSVTGKEHEFVHVSHAWAGCHVPALVTSDLTRGTHATMCLWCRLAHKARCSALLLHRTPTTPLPCHRQ